LRATAPARCSTLSLHGALPISGRIRGAGALLALAGTLAGGVVRAGSRLRPGTGARRGGDPRGGGAGGSADRDPPCSQHQPVGPLDRKSTRLNSSHVAISYAVFC